MNPYAQKNETKERPKRDADVETKQDVVDGSNTAIIQLTGGLLQSAFGVAYTQDIQKVVKRIDDIDGNLQSNIQTVKVEQNHLSQETRDTLTKQDRTIHMVEKMAKTVDKKVGKTFFILCCFFRELVLVNLLLSKRNIFQSIQLHIFWTL